MPENTVLFDPGFSPFVEPFVDNIIVCEQIISSQKNIHQKKFKFQILYPQIKKLLENNIAFYYGCLLWAFYLSNQYKLEPARISRNQFLELSQETINEYDFLEQIKSIKDYIPKFEKDAKYYLGKSANIPVFWSEVLELYLEFVNINLNFVSTENTSDIKLPEKFTVACFDSSLQDNIMKSIADKKIETLLNIKIFA